MVGTENAAALLAQQDPLRTISGYFVTHAPATGLHDKDDYAHRGVNAFRWLIDTFRPRYHLHGHVHRYNPLAPHETQYKQTKIINVYGYREINL